jgi:catechol 2,3-dioxygenase-like lactoylglutathione lyase family enzyme
MRRLILAALLSASASAAVAAPTPKEQLLVPPANATHFVVVSTAGKHGDEYAWALPDGRMAFRESILLRGLIFETDDCRATYEELKAAGVEFTQEPVERFYGIDCAARDPFGNPIRITQPPDGPVVVPSPEELEAQSP